MKKITILLVAVIVTYVAIALIPKPLNDNKYFDIVMSLGTTIEAEEITNFQDSSVRFEVTISRIDTLGFNFPARAIMSKRFYFITSQDDIDSLKANTVFNTLMTRSRNGHNFWFNN